MTAQLHIAAAVQLKEGVFFRNGKPYLPDTPAPDSENWFRQQYRLLEVNYPKFHKMDELCKLAVLSAEVLFDEELLSSFDLQKTGMLIYNQHSSIDADLRHQQSVSDTDHLLPSPAVFVYTLPNIMLGEICIRYGITGENLCLIEERFDATAAEAQCRMMFDCGMEQVVMGWIDHHRGYSKAWMACVTKGEKAPNYSQLSTRILTEIDNIPQWKHS